MNEVSYTFSKIDNRLTFDFESVSNEKVIKKRIEFRMLYEQTELYNLALVDILANGSASDLVISNNQDMPKVIATVFQAIVYFFDKNSTAKIFIQGSTGSRTRLYQMAISKYLPELEQKFYIWGFVDTEIALFEKGKNYDSFIISLKINQDYENQ